MLDDESKKDPVKYNQWFKQFGNNLKAGVQSDPDNKEAIFKLLRFLGTFSEKRDEMISLDHYVDAMKTGQTKIYFSLSQTRDGVEASPFYEPFREMDVPVLLLTHELDEFLLMETGNFKEHDFMSIEQANIEQLRKEIGAEARKVRIESSIPEEDVSNFCIWLKETLAHKIATVQMSKRLVDPPAVAFGPMSTSMYMAMQMMALQSGQGGGEIQYPKDLTLEINGSHPTIVNLNELRKKNLGEATQMSKVFLD